MLTEDDIAKAVRDGEMSVDDAVAAFDGDEVVVYPKVAFPEGSENWVDVENAQSGSTLFADLAAFGATDEQMDRVTEGIDRLREVGSTLDQVYGWPPGFDQPDSTPDGDDEGDERDDEDPAADGE